MMGCDIHGWVEIKKDSKWIAVKELKDSDRNYERFAALAGVRYYDGKSDAKPLGVPDDVSETAKYSIECWDSDGHSHSYLPIDEATEIFLATAWQPSDYYRAYPTEAFFGVDKNEGEFRLVFWFDN